MQAARRSRPRDASYASGRDADVSDEQINFWLAKLRSPEFLREAVAQFSAQAARSPRPAVIAARGDGDVAEALASEQATEMSADRAYWELLRLELEAPTCGAAIGGRRPHG